tara:strand:+ start:253 stop:1017 length:765 start_codon:yes stop_codon:yes gene_type:complete
MSLCALLANARFVHASGVLDETDVFKLFQTCRNAFSCLDHNIISETCLLVLKKDCEENVSPLDIGDYVTHFVKTHSDNIHYVRYNLMRIYQMHGKLKGRKFCTICDNIVDPYDTIKINIVPTWHKRKVTVANNFEDRMETEDIYLNTLEYCFQTNTGKSKTFSTVKTKGAYGLCKECLCNNDFISVRSFCKAKGLVPSRVQREIMKERGYNKVTATWQKEAFLPKKVLFRYNSPKMKYRYKHLKDFGFKRLLST